MEIEEAINKLNKLKNQKYDAELLYGLQFVEEKDNCKILTTAEQEAIETLINGYRNLQNIEKELESKENQVKLKWEMIDNHIPKID